MKPCNQYVFPILLGVLLSLSLNVDARITHGTKKALKPLPVKPPKVKSRVPVAAPIPAPPLPEDPPPAPTQAPSAEIVENCDATILDNMTFGQFNDLLNSTNDQDGTLRICLGPGIEISASSPAEIQCTNPENSAVETCSGIELRRHRTEIIGLSESVPARFTNHLDKTVIYANNPQALSYYRSENFIEDVFQNHPMAAHRGSARYPQIFLNPIQGLVLKNLEITTHGADAQAIKLDHTQVTALENLTIRNMGGGNNVELDWVNADRLQNVRILAGNATGIDWDHGHATLIDGLTIQKGGQGDAYVVGGGVYMSGATFATVRNVHISGQNTYGFYQGNSNRITFSGERVFENYTFDQESGMGLRFGGYFGTFVDVLRNLQISTGGAVALDLDTAQVGILENCQLESHFTTGPGIGLKMGTRPYNSGSNPTMATHVGAIHNCTIEVAGAPQLDPQENPETASAAIYGLREDQVATGLSLSVTGAAHALYLSSIDLLDVFFWTGHGVPYYYGNQEPPRPDVGSTSITVGGSGYAFAVECFRQNRRTIDHDTLDPQACFYPER